MADRLTPEREAERRRDASERERDAHRREVIEPVLVSVTIVDGIAGHVIDSGNACTACQDAIHSEQPMTPRQCASCVHRHHPHTICSGRSGGTGYRCGCVCSEARSR